MPKYDLVALYMARLAPVILGESKPKTVASSERRCADCDRPITTCMVCNSTNVRYWVPVVGSVCSDHMAVFTEDPDYTDMFDEDFGSCQCKLADEKSRQDAGPVPTGEACKSCNMIVNACMVCKQNVVGGYHAETIGSVCWKHRDHLINLPHFIVSVDDDMVCEC